MSKGGSTFDVHKKKLNILKQNHTITKEDLPLYLAVLLIFGLNNGVNLQHCWNSKKIYSYNGIVSDLMSFDKFQFIKRHITCISYNDLNGIRLKKLPKIIGGLEKFFTDVYTPGEHLAIDEGMIPYKEKMRNMVYCPVQPDKWGLKFYILAESTTGFVCNLRIVGEESSINDTVLSLCRHVTGVNRKLFMDNFYNSFTLVQMLCELKIYTTGTLRHKRSRPSDLLTLKKEVKVDSLIILEKDRTQVLIWHDKKPVVVISNCYNSSEYVEGKEKVLPVTVHEYNTYMGGGDKFDQMIKYYPLKRKTNRCTQKFTLQLFEILLHNAYVLYKQFIKSESVTHYDFIENIISYLIKKGKGVTVKSVEYNIKNNLIKTYHLPIKLHKRSNCKLCYSSCNLRSTKFFKCRKCDVFICISPCFYSYHADSDKVPQDFD
ncbi:PiggyBac transposable element-derived protein 4 [Dictyocoela muelleri]|nr:PiggyBac transposable element-derived protein 4 [Dictyocoela muelleri]